MEKIEPPKPSVLESLTSTEVIIEQDAKDDFGTVTEAITEQQYPLQDKLLEDNA